jgi:hypothetical protein
MNKDNLIIYGLLGIGVITSLMFLNENEESEESEEKPKKKVIKPKKEPKKEEPKELSAEK